MQPLWATGDGQDLWVLIVQDDQKHLLVMHRNHRTDEPDRLYHAHINKFGHAVPLRGRIVPGGLACADGKLWLVYQGATPKSRFPVQSIAVDTNQKIRSLRYSTPAFEPSLRPGLILRSFTANHAGPWALVRVEDLDTLNNIDASQKTTPLKANTSPTSLTTQPTDHKQTPTSETLQTTPPPQTPPTQIESQPDRSEAVHEDRLLRLDRKKWINVDLPQDWPNQSRSWLLMRRTDDDFPLLVTATPAEDRIEIRVYHRQNHAWVSRLYALDPDHLRFGHDNATWTPKRLRISEAIALTVNGQLLVGFISTSPQGVGLDVSVFRDGAVTPLGTLTVTASSAKAWAALPHAWNTALLVMDTRSQLSWSHLDLQGHTTGPQPLSVATPRPLGNMSRWLIQMAVVVIATITILAMQDRNQPKLSKKIQLADLAKRAAAGGFDLLPCLMLVSGITDTQPSQILAHWPWHVTQWHEMTPGFVVIALFLLHTTLSEMFTAKTIGKSLMGIRVASLDGSPPNIWQALTRNITKILDLISPPLLIMPVVWPFRQRLGDVAARTVVITDPPKQNDSTPF